MKMKKYYISHKMNLKNELKSMDYSLISSMLYLTKNLPDGELNPGLPRDRRGYSPLYYLGLLITKHCKYSIVRYNKIKQMKS